MSWRFLTVLALTGSLTLACEDKADLLNMPFDAAGMPQMVDAARALGPGEIEQDPGAPRSAEDLKNAKVAAEDGKAIKKKGAAPIKKLDAYRLKIGDVLVDRLNKQLKIPCKVNMDEGILEYYACGTGGKLHESALECMIQPSHLHVGALLLGLEPAQILRDPTNKQPDKITREGGTVRLFVELKDQEKIPAETWLYDRKSNGSPAQKEWHFLGSKFWSKQYSADGTLSIIGLVPDDSVIFESKNFTGNPYQGGDLGYEVNKKTIPKKGTPLTLILELVRAEGIAPKVAKVAPQKKIAPDKAPKPAAGARALKSGQPTPAQPTP